MTCIPARWAARIPAGASSSARHFDGIHAEQFGGFEENIRCGFAIGHVVGGHHLIKPIGDADDFEGLLDHHPRAAGGDRHRHLAAEGFGEGGHFLDQGDRVAGA